MSRLPLCTPEELREELTDITRDLERAEFATPVSPEAKARRLERVACLRGWRDDLTAQLAETVAA